MNGPEIESKKLPGALVCLPLAVAVLLVMLPTLELGTRLFSGWYWWGVILGVAMMILSIFCHRAGKRHAAWYLLSLFLNGCGDGFSLSALYIHKHLVASAQTNLPGVIPAACALLLSCVLLLLLSKRKRLAAILAALCALSSLIYSFGSNAPFWVFACFASLLGAVFLIPMVRLTGHPERGALRQSSFAGFGAFVLITIVVVFLLSEGEILDGLDFGDVFSGGKKNKQPRAHR